MRNTTKKNKSGHKHYNGSVPGPKGEKGQHGCGMSTAADEPYGDLKQVSAEELAKWDQIAELFEPKGTEDKLFLMLEETLRYYAMRTDGEKARAALDTLLMSPHAAEDAKEKEDDEDFQEHVDDWIDKGRCVDPYENYAKFFMTLHRWPAMRQYQFEQIIRRLELYCTYNNKRYRVTGGSRSGCVYLTPDLQSTQYKIGVDVRECSEWYPHPIHPNSSVREFPFEPQNWFNYCLEHKLNLSNTLVYGTQLDDGIETMFNAPTDFLEPKNWNDYISFRIEVLVNWRVEKTILIDASDKSKIQISIVYGEAKKK